MKRSFWLSLLLVVVAAPSWAAGVIIIHDADHWWPGPHPPHPIPVPMPRPILPRPMPPPFVWAPLEVSFAKVNARIRDQVAVTTVEQEFYNPNPRQLEGTFLFPVPQGAHLDKFTMEINGRPAEAELLTADKARSLYEDIVRKLKDPALLEYSGRDLFKVRVFPIEPNSRKRLTLSYTQLLKSDAGLVAFRFPLNTEKFSAKPLWNLAVKLDLETQRPLKSVYSPTHKVEVRRHGERGATVGFEAADVKPDLDFELFFSQETADVGLSLLTHKLGSDDGYFLLLASPGDVKTGKTVPKDVAFVLDTSGSMAGAKLEQAKKALLFCVENLNDADRFEILRFATEVEPLFDKLAEASPGNRSRAGRFIKDLKPIGGTAIDDALKKALSIRPDRSDRPYVVIFLTDGRPTVGVTDEKRIVDHALQAAASTRVFCFGIGTDVNTHLLDKITEGTRAVSEYVLPEEDIEVKVSSFFAKIKEPVLANPKLKFPDGVRVTKTYPTALPDLFKGEQLVVAGRYSGRANGDILLEGTVNGERRAFEFTAAFAGESVAHDFIPRLWATRRVGYLLDEIRLHGENRELKDEVVELARRYGIVTPYTAYLILEDEQRRGVALDQRSFRELEQSRTAQSEMGAVYYSFRSDTSGDRAVSGARSYQSLKDASAPQDALVMSGAEALRVAPSAAPVALQERAARARGTVAGGSGISGTSKARPAQPSTRELANEFARQSQFINGRAFYQNGAQWVDAEAQKQAAAKRVRLQFGSDGYFEFAKKNPQAQSWLALGRNVQFVLGETLYEIHD
ncbi:MAG: VWA domain-containing protein [Verrucomicrobia bacterium]|nr:VWA domain-containing protein [Verrucomicrobiota bacterium]